jgi:hypothetical protein
MGVMPFWSKTPQMEIGCGLDFSDSLPAGVTITECECSATAFSDDTDAGDELLSGGTSATISGSVATILVSAGSAGTLYNLRFLATLSDNQVIEGVGRLMVDI